MTEITLFEAILLIVTCVLITLFGYWVGYKNGKSARK